MTMSCLIVLIYLKRRISILAVLVSEFLLFVFLVLCNQNSIGIEYSVRAQISAGMRYAYSPLPLLHVEISQKRHYQKLFISCKSG